MDSPGTQGRQWCCIARDIVPRLGICNRRSVAVDRRGSRELDVLLMVERADRRDSCRRCIGPTCRNDGFDFMQRDYSLA